MAPQVKKRTNKSHVMQYGDMSLSKEFRSLFMGPNYPDLSADSPGHSKPTYPSLGGLVSQRDAKLAYLSHKVPMLNSITEFEPPSIFISNF